jgi:hypothetical protein
MEKKTMIFIFLLTALNAQAGFLRILPEPNLRLEKQAQGLLLSGQFSIENKGTELARDVYPELKLDQFSWVGEKRILQAGEKFTWEISETILRKQLEEPLSGEFVLQIMDHYQDFNGYSFAIPNATILSLDTKTDSESNVPTMELKIESTAVNQFSGQIQIFNPASSPQSYQISYLLPQEVEMVTPQVPVEVPAGGELSTNFQFENRKGLIGSNYQAFVVLQWVSENQRRALIKTAPFRIEKVSTKWSLEQSFWAWWVWGLAVGLIFMWVFWIRPLRRLVSRSRYSRARL